MVFHDQIFNDLSDLPTFNSNAIEMNLHHIKDIRTRSENSLVPGDFEDFLNEFWLDGAIQ